MILRIKTLHAAPGSLMEGKNEEVRGRRYRTVQVMIKSTFTILEVWEVRPKKGSGGGCKKLVGDKKGRERPLIRANN